MDGDLEVTITTDSGRRLTRRFPARSTAKALKHFLAKEWSIPVVCQALLLGPVCLSDSDILFEVSGGAELALELRASFGLLGADSTYQEPDTDFSFGDESFPVVPAAESGLDRLAARPQSPTLPRRELAQASAADATGRAASSAPVSLLDKFNAQARQIQAMEKRLASLQEEVIRLRSASIAQSALSEDLKKGLQSESGERLRLSDVLHDLLRITENLSEGVHFRRHVLLEEDVERLSAKLEDREPMTTAPPQVTVLRLAAAGDVAELEQALEDMDGASVNGSSCRGKTPLMYAASYGRSEAVASLLSRRASVGAADAFGRGAMHFAAARLGASDAEQAKMVNRLLKAGASVKQVDSSAASALTYAERWGQKMTVSLLREAGAPQAKDPEVLLLKSQRSEEAGLEATPRVSRRESEVNG